nr:phosphatidylinositol phosphate phosphatase [Cryptococcus depauperatus CBS 7841]
MTLALYLRPSPRAFFIFASTGVLLFRQPSAQETKASKSVVVAEFLPQEEINVYDLVKVGEVEGVLGVVSVPSDRSPIPEIFLLLLTHTIPLPPLVPSSSLRPCKLISVDFYSLSSSYWDSPELCNVPQMIDYEDEYENVGATYAGGSQATLSNAQREGVSHPCSGMKKYLESSSFFHAEGCKWDISSRLSSSSNWIREAGLVTHPLEEFDDRFVWNKSLLEPFLAFRKGLEEKVRTKLDRASLLIPIIQGFCGSLPIFNGGSLNGTPPMASLGLISRLSWKRAGARFRTRGIDDDGQVANFVETEVLMALEDKVMSYVQVRGSVPLFWEQPSQGLQTLQQRVEITRPPQATQPAFDKHFLELLEHYNCIHAINLLGQKDAEAKLSLAYSSHLAALKENLEQIPKSEKEDMVVQPRGALELTPYDFHSVVRIEGHDAVRRDLDKELVKVMRSREKFGWTLVDIKSGEVVVEQCGVFRTNCLDCLDRTNYVQDILSALSLTSFLRSISSPLLSFPTLWAAHRELWADNGDRLSKIYAGTGAINTSATRSGKKTLAGFLSDATKSVSRAYVNNFQDRGKQAAIDLLLGMVAGQRPVILFDPISEKVQAALAERVEEFSSNRKVVIFAGTWNLNGKAPHEALDDWLFPLSELYLPDIYMVAFQEVVELTPGQILQTDPAKRQKWEKHIMETFQMHRPDQYLLFRSDQLVGTVLMVILKKPLAPHLRNVESAAKKTGLQGLSGNKGGIAIRFNLYDSTVCLVTCHLAAGHGNVGDRNADWRTVVSGLKFLRGKLIDDHEIIIWAADFNYRIAMSNPEVRGLIERNELDALLGADQMLNAVDEGEIFMGYDEGPIRFNDNGTENYDTSEKQRIPSWTDRILFKGSSLRLKEYARAELMTSDHRPVYAIFDATIKKVDQERKEEIAKELLHEILSKDEKKKLGEKLGIEVGDESVRNTIREMAKGESLNILPSPRADSSPRLSPRPRSSSSVTEKGNPTLATANGRIRSISSLQPPSTSASSSLRALATSHSSTSLSSRRRPTPPLPPRPGYSPTSSSINLLPLQHANKSLTPPSQSISHTAPVETRLPTASRASFAPSSPIIPSSTGDFVMIPKAAATTRRAPPLPPRAVASSQPSAKQPSSTSVNVPRPKVRPSVLPAPRKSLDLNGSPPKGLVSPVRPDIVMAKIKSSRPPPPAPRQKPIERATSLLASSPATTASGRKAGETGRTETCHERSASSSPESRQRPPPVIPTKPSALRGIHCKTERSEFGEKTDR